MSFNSYEGKDIGGYRDYRITESNIRPASCRFEAHLVENDGQPSLFGATIEEVQGEIDEKHRDEDMDQFATTHEEQVEEALNGRR